MKYLEKTFSVYVGAETITDKTADLDEVFGRKDDCGKEKDEKTVRDVPVVQQD